MLEYLPVKQRFNLVLVALRVWGTQLLEFRLWVEYPIWQVKNCHKGQFFSFVPQCLGASLSNSTCTNSAWFCCQGALLRARFPPPTTTTTTTIITQQMLSF